MCSGVVARLVGNAGGVFRFVGFVGVWFLSLCVLRIFGGLLWFVFGLVTGCGVLVSWGVGVWGFVDSWVFVDLLGSAIMFEFGLDCAGSVVAWIFFGVAL